MGNRKLKVSTELCLSNISDSIENLFDEISLKESEIDELKDQVYKCEKEIAEQSATIDSLKREIEEYYNQ